jgi:hypothetical protein
VTKVIRFDHGSLRKPERTAQGFLRVDGLAARVGVLEYRNKDGSIRRELRLPEEVSRADSLAAFEGISVTDGHPTVLVDANNVRTLEAGTVTGGARMDGDWVVTPIVVKDKKLIAKIDAGQTGLSVGYQIREDWTPGVHPVYGAYDLIQRDIVPNHIAGAVPVPRAGDGARIRMDGVDVDTAVQVSDEESASVTRTDQQIDRSHVVNDLGTTRGNHMDKDEQIRLLQTQLGDATKRATQLEADLKVRTDERDTASGKLAVVEKQAEDIKTRLDSGLAAAETEKVKEVQTRLDTAETEIAGLKASIPELVRKRASLVTRAQAILGDDYRADALDDKTILEAGIKRFDPKADLSKESVVGLQARFDAFYDARAKTAASTARAGAAVAVRTDSQPTEIDPFDPLHNGAGQYASPHAAKKGA